MKRIILLFLAVVSVFAISGCSESNDTTLGGEVPPNVYNVKVSPTSTQRGEELTVTFNVHYYEIYNEHLITVEVIDGQLFAVSIPEDSEKSNYRNMNNLVNFNIEFEENAKSQTKTENGKTAVFYDTGAYNIINAVNPNKYTYFKWDSATGDGEVRCIVPEKAISGVIKLEGLGISNCGFSDEKLIIVDENGNEITE